MDTQYSVSYDFIDSFRKNVSLKEFIRLSETRFFNQVDTVIEAAIENKVRLIRVAGPSGSGKTTSTKRIVEALRENGIPAYYMSMDNWYKTLKVEDMPRTEDGDPDYESPDILDIDGFKEDVTNLLNGEVIYLREFDFTNRISNKSNRKMKCESNSIIVIEGLHAINPMFNTEFKDLKVYAEPFNIRLANGACLTSSQIRLCRRMHRDATERGMSFEDTIRKCRSVDRGQDKYITPFMNDANVLRINTLILYEIFIHRNELPDAKCLNCIDKSGITKDMIPKNSILKEFYR